jgi:hypothetical protein
VVVLSAAGIDGLREAAHLRATAVLGKPLDLDVVSTVIEHVLREWTTPSHTEPSGRPIGVCPICGVTAYADFSLEEPDHLRAMHSARINHVLSHSAADIAGVSLRKRLLQLPPEGRRTLATWFYHELRKDWGDQDRRGVHSIDAVLGSPAVRRLWHDALTCGFPGCRHGES